MKKKRILSLMLFLGLCSFAFAGYTQTSSDILLMKKLDAAVAIMTSEQRAKAIEKLRMYYETMESGSRMHYILEQVILKMKTPRGEQKHGSPEITDEKSKKPDFYVKTIEYDHTSDDMLITTCDNNHQYQGYLRLRVHVNKREAMIKKFVPKLTEGKRCVLYKINTQKLRMVRGFQHEFEARVDPTGLIAEYDESNNYKKQKINLPAFYFGNNE